MIIIDFPDTQKHFTVTFRGTSHFAHSRCAPPFETFGAGHSYLRVSPSRAKRTSNAYQSWGQSCSQAFRNHRIPKGELFEKTKKQSFFKSGGRPKSRGGGNPPNISPDTHRFLLEPLRGANICKFGKLHGVRGILAATKRCFFRTRGWVPDDHFCRCVVRIHTFFVISSISSDKPP